MRGAKVGGFERAADTKQFVSLNRGNHAYVFGVDGRRQHVAVGTAAFVAAAGPLLADERLGARARAELETLAERYPGAGWDDPLTAPAATEDDDAGDTGDGA